MGRFDLGKYLLPATFIADIMLECHRAMANRGRRCPRLLNGDIRQDDGRAFCGQ